MTDYDKWAKFEVEDDDDKENDKPPDNSDVLKEIPQELDHDLALCLAAKEKKHDLLEELLLAKADVNAVDPHGRTPLHLVLAKPCSVVNVRPIIETLLKATADVNMASDEGITPLSMAAEIGHEELMEALIECGPRNQRALDHAVFIAAKSCETIITRRLMAAHANPWGFDDLGLCCLHYWAAQGDTALIRIAIYHSSFKTVDCITNGGISPLQVALRHADVSTCLVPAGILIEAKADVNHEAMNGETALNMCRDVKATELIIASGANINHEPRLHKTALYASAEGCREEQMACLLQHKADPNIGQLSSLCCAVRSESVACCRLLLDAKALVNVREPYSGSLPLPIAAQLENVEIVEMLLDANADASLQDQNGTPPLLRTASVDIVRLLINKGGVNVNDQGADRKSALVLAAGSGNEEMCSLLVDAKANVNMLGPCTPLQAAAANGHENTLLFLLKNGAHKHTRTNGFDARQLAERSDFPALAEVIDNF